MNHDGVADVGLTQVGGHQIRQFQIGFAEPGLLQMGVRAVDFGEVGFPEIGPRELRVVVFNPLPQARQAVA